MPRIARFAIVMFALLPALAACGGGDDSTSTAAGVRTTSTSSLATSSTSSSSTSSSSTSSSSATDGRYAMPASSTTTAARQVATTTTARPAATTTTTARPATTTTAAPQHSVLTMSIAAYMFSPSRPTVRAGVVQVSVKNNDPVDHTFTVTGTSIDIAAPARGGGSATATLKAGSYEFHCRIHSSMTGTLTVTA